MKTNKLSANILITLKDIVEYIAISIITIRLWYHISNIYNLDQKDILELLKIFTIFGLMNFTFTFFTGLLACIRNREVSDIKSRQKITRPIRLFRPLFAILVLFLISTDGFKHFVDHHTYEGHKTLYISLIYHILFTIFLLFFSYNLLDIIRDEIYQIARTTRLANWYNELNENSSYKPFTTDTKIIKDISEIVTLLLVASSTTARDGINIIPKITNSLKILPENLAFNVGIVFIPILASLIAWEHWKPAATIKRSATVYEVPLKICDYFTLISIYILFTISLTVVLGFIMDLSDKTTLIHISTQILLPMALTGVVFRNIRK